MANAHGSFNGFLVVLSYVISACGAFTALVLAVGLALTREQAVRAMPARA